MKICVISTPVFAVKDQGLTGYGGLEQIAWHCAEQLAKQGNEVALVAPEGSTCPNVQVITNGKPGTWNERTAFNSYHEELNKFDVIIDHTWMKYSYLKKGKGDLKAPVLGVLHAPVNTMYQTLPPNVENPCFVAISSDQSRHFEVLFNRRAEVCWNGIDTSFYKNIGLPRTDRYLFLARFSTIKGPHIAIDVCKNTKTKLDLIGDTQITGEPEYLKKCQDAILGYPDIQFLGGKNRGECVWYFSQAKALLHPNKLFREPFGLAPVESLACGTPVIAWKYGAMGETVIHGTTGFLVETQNQIEKIIKEDLVSTIKPEHCREHVERFFTIQRMGHRYQELCQMAIEEGW